MRYVMLSRRSFQSFATTAWRIAAQQTASSTRVQTSQTRNSSVGYVWCGRTPHQILEPSGMEFVRTSDWRTSLESPYDRLIGGMPVRGKVLQMVLRYGLNHVRRPIQKGELVEIART